MRRKVWSIGLMICLLLGMWVQAPQAQETQTESDYAGRARELMSALERNDYISQEGGETVTRAQFTATLMEALGYDTAAEEETSPFEDVSGSIHTPSTGRWKWELPHFRHNFGLTRPSPTQRR